MTVEQRARLLLMFAQDQFDVFVTIDRSLESQQNLAKLKMGIIVCEGAQQ